MTTELGRRDGGRLSAKHPIYLIHLVVVVVVDVVAVVVVVLVAAATSTSTSRRRNLQRHGAEKRRGRKFFSFFQVQDIKKTPVV